MDMTPAQFDEIVRSERLTEIVCALIAKRVTATSVLSGTSKASAAAIAADAKLIVAELEKA